MSAPRDSKKSRRPKGVTLSGLLNALDGVAATESRVLFLTTNHRAHLDEALLRPGRVDRRYWIGSATAEQAARLFLRFFPDETDRARRFGSIVNRGEECSMAVLQNALVTNADSPERAVADLDAQLIKRGGPATDAARRINGDAPLFNSVEIVESEPGPAEAAAP